MIKEDILYPAMLDACVIEEELWFSNTVANALMAVSLKTGKLKHFHTFKDYPYDARSLHQTIFAIGNKVVLCPDVGSNKIIIYDRLKDEEISIVLDEEVIIKNVYRVNKELWLFPTRFDMGVYILNPDSYEIRKWNQWEKLGYDNIGCSTVQMNGTFYVQVAQSNVILEINDAEIVEHKIDIDCRGLIPLEVVSESLIVGASDRLSLYLVDIKTWYCKKVYEEKSDIDGDRFMRLKSSNNTVIGIKRFGLDIVMINTVIAEQNKISFSKDYILQERKNFPFYFRGVILWKNSFLVLPIVGKGIRMIDTSNNEIRDIEIEMSKEWLKHCYRYNMVDYVEKGLVTETSGLKLEDFLEIVRFGS